MGGSVVVLADSRGAILFSVYGRYVYVTGSAENVPNCGFYNYVLAAVLSAYIILMIFCFFGSCEL